MASLLDLSDNYEGIFNAVTYCGIVIKWIRISGFFTFCWSTDLNVVDN